MSQATAIVIGPEERLRITLLFSLLLHGILILGITFAYEEPAASLPSLDIILVQAKSDNNPDKPDFLANATQQGGGEHDKAQRPREPLSGAIPKVAPGVAPIPMTAGAPKPAPAAPQPVITGRNPAFEVNRVNSSKSSPAMPAVLARELIERDLEMARLAAEIDRQAAAYAKRPKRKFISASTQEYAFANYMRSWVTRVESIGNLNYPEEAKRQKIHGQIVLTVAIRKDGKVERIDVIQSSGFKLLDEAAIRIVRLSEPFSPLPFAVDSVDVLHITRTWQFLPGNVIKGN